MGSQEVPARPVMLIMMALSFLIYIFLIPEYPIYSEYDNYEPNIVEVQEVEVKSRLGKIVGLVISVVVLITFVSAGIICNYRLQKEYQEPSSVLEEESVERNDEAERRKS